MKPLSTMVTRDDTWFDRTRGSRERFAVIGTGAAGIGVLSALLDARSDADITIFDVGRPVREPPQEPSADQGAVAEFYNGIYREIRATQTFKFPPPKTHFTEPLPKSRVGKNRSIFRSESFGGLTNYWGGTMLPFTDHELAKWPLDRKTMDPYYRKMADVVGIAGRKDGLNNYIGEDYCNRPPLQATRMLDRLGESVNVASDRSNLRADYRIVAGVNRCTLETRSTRKNQCVYCGECLAGCFAGSIWRANDTLHEYLHDPRIDKVVTGKVLAVHPERQLVRFRSDSGEQNLEGFAKIFLCAGCPGSTEIFMRSTGVNDVADMADNAVYVFPILYLGRLRGEDRQRTYLSLSNLVFGCVPRTDGRRFAQAQIYPNFDYLWRYNVPPRLWPMLGPLVAYSRSRLFWARLYVHGDESQAYRMRLEDDEAVYDLARTATGEAVPSLMKSIRSAVNRNGFWIPPIRPLLQKANSHYAATLPYGGKQIDVPPSGEALPGVYLCDSSCFPELPAVSLTFTIMANAYRTAWEAVTPTGLAPRDAAAARAMP